MTTKCRGVSDTYECHFKGSDDQFNKVRLTINMINWYLVSICLEENIRRLNEQANSDM